MLERERLEAEKRRFAEERLDESQYCEGNDVSRRLIWRMNRVRTKCATTAASVIGPTLSSAIHQVDQWCDASSSCVCALTNVFSPK